MVRNVRHFIRQSLAQAWALLLRSLSPSARALARRAAPDSERPLGANTRFTVTSVVVNETVDVPAIVRQVAEESHARFSSGVLFGELTRVTDANAVLVARVTERGVRDAEHFIALYPRQS